MNNIIFCLDDNFLFYINYVLKTFNKFHDLKNYIFYFVLTDSDKNIHHKLIEILNNIDKNINYKYSYFEPDQDFINLVESFTNTMKTKSGFKIYNNLANWSRYFIDLLFPEIKLGLYLDLDILLNGNIDSLFEIECKNIAVVPNNVYDKTTKKIKDHINSDLFENICNSLFKKNDIDIEKFDNYGYNCGVILINFNHYKEINVRKKLEEYFKYVKENNRFHKPSGTQYIFNFLFSNYKPLDVKYNHILKYDKKYQKALILHFKGSKNKEKYTNIYEIIMKK